LTTEIAVWEDDPMSVPLAYTIRMPVPQMNNLPLAIEIIGNAPDPAIYSPGTAEFRYWTAAAALVRAVSYWCDLLPHTSEWEVGTTLPVRLDAGVDLNAYYSRDEDQKGLSFFHDTVNGKTVYSGESSDVICHELGHAILDIIRPDLYNAASDEIAAFHESFADISAILSGLQIQSLRETVLVETHGDLRRSSRLSRLGEQLGWAIRQVNPDKADADCLRNAANAFLYQDPTTLPISGRSSVLTSDPHSFSRVFTGAFFDALANMLALQSLTPTEADLLRVSQEIGKLLIEALHVAPATSDFCCQVAFHMLEADKLHFDGKYNTALTNAFVSRRILSTAAMAMIRPILSSRTAVAQAMVAPEHKVSTGFLQVTLSTASYGLRSKTLLVNVPDEGERLPTGPLGVVDSPSAETVARSFVDYLFLRGKVDVGRFADANFGMIRANMRGKTHRLTQTPRGLVLTRVMFE